MCENPIMLFSKAIVWPKLPECLQLEPADGTKSMAASLVHLTQVSSSVFFRHQCLLSVAPLWVERSPSKRKKQLSNMFAVDYGFAINCLRCFQCWQPFGMKARRYMFDIVRRALVAR